MVMDGGGCREMISLRAHAEMARAESIGYFNVPDCGSDGVTSTKVRTAIVPAPPMRNLSTAYCAVSRACHGTRGREACLRGGIGFGFKWVSIGFD